MDESVNSQGAEKNFGDQAADKVPERALNGNVGVKNAVGDQLVRANGRCRRQRTKTENARSSSTEKIDVIGGPGRRFRLVLTTGSLFIGFLANDAIPRSMTSILNYIRRLYT